MSESKIINLFRSYYANLKEEDLNVRNLENREFAIWNFNSNTMKRHLAFKDSKELKKFLISQSPRHVYYSASIYEYPSIPDMEMKRIVKTDLIFDIDIDHVPTECKKIHDSWTCKNCNNSGKGYVEVCPVCNSYSLEKFSFVCNECLNVAKEKALILIEDFLFSDLGVSKDEVKIVFSGNRGYHIHVFNEEWSSLDSKARSMLIDYIKGISAKLYLHEYLKKNKYKFKGILASGFPSRFAEKLLETMLTIDNMINKLDLKKEIIEGIMSNKERIILAMQGYVCDYSFIKEFGKKAKDILNKVIEEISVEIDERVTVDLHRLIRMPNTIHGKTGLKVTSMNYEDLENFEPYRDSIVFKKGYAKIKYKVKADFPKIIMDETEYDLQNIENKPIPLFLALYLALNEYATINEFI
jgi:DNA primase small subunit